MKQQSTRGLFIDMEGFTSEGNEKDQELLKRISSQLSTKFKLITFISIPKDKQTELKYIERESPKMFNRASLMLYAHLRELKRTEMLDNLNNGYNIITLNYCYDKIIKSLNEDLDLNFAKHLFKGLIRPDFVLFYQGKNIDNFFETKNFKNIENNNKKGIFTEYEDDIISIYNFILNKYNNWNDSHKKNYYPNSIGEDLFINYPEYKLNKYKEKI